MLNPTYIHSAVMMSIGRTWTWSQEKSGSNPKARCSRLFTSPVFFSNISEASIPLNTSPTSCGLKKISR